MAVVVAAGLCSMALTNCAPASEGNGDAERPSIVSLNPCTDAILVAVAEPEQILALSHYSRAPQSSSIAPGIARRFDTTGGTAEEVIALDPDIVLAGAFLQPATGQALQDLGVDVATFGIASEVEASFAQIRRIAELAGKPDRGAALIDDIAAALQRHTPPQGTAQLSAVLWQPGQIVPGEQTLMAQLMGRAGFSSHSEALGLGQADYLSLEQVLADPPQVLLVAGEARAQQHPALAELQGTAIESFDPGLLYCGGPTIIRAMERLGTIRQAQS